MKAGEEESEEPHTVVSGMFVVNTLTTKVLFDAGAKHSFINAVTTKQIACDLDKMDIQLCVTTPIGSMHQSELIARNCSVTFHEKMFLADLILLGIQEYDVILGMNWLAKYRLTIDCQQKTLVFVTPEGESLVYKGKHPNYTIPLISAAKAPKLVGKGCTAFPCAIDITNTLEMRH